MQQLLSVWAVLDMRKRVVVILATAIMFAAVLGLSRMATQPSMSLLYAGLESGVAGDVITALEARGARFEVRSGSIFVESGMRDTLRMTLASEGLPANSNLGYEILDNLSGFSTTSQMFNAAYWRAKEGELARTIIANPAIHNARVHLGNPSSLGLRRSPAPTASVTVTTSNSTLSAKHARALKYMVSSAVSGLLPENVSVIDSQGGLIISGEDSNFGAVTTANRTMELRRNVERLLEARVGHGNAVVEISIDTVAEHETIMERLIDPESRVAISNEIEESTNSSIDSRNSGVSVASNLPTGDGASSDGQSSTNNSETRERTNFEVSETTREIIRIPGAIRRISVAVLVDGIRGTDAGGQEVWSPRPEEEMASLRELVASAVGFDEARGDTITLKTLEFKPIAQIGTMAAPGVMQNLHLDIMSLLQLAVLAIVALVLGFFVLRPILSSAHGEGVQPRLVAATPSALPPGAELGTGLAGDSGNDLPTLPALTGEIDGGPPGFPEMAVMSDFDFGDPGGSSLPALGGGTTDPVERLRALIEERQTETVEILRGWMEDKTA